MSQFSIRNLREVSDNPSDKFANEIAKKLAKFLNKQETDKLENKEDIYSNGQDIDTVIKYHSELSGNKYFDFLTQYFPPTEPDGNKLRLWIRGTNLGNETQDLSTFDNDGTIEGDPVLVNGTPFDDGIKTGGCKSIALRLNRPTSDFENEEYIKVDDINKIRINGISTGVSYFARFRIFDLANQSGFDRTLFEKIDDSTPNDGIRVTVTSDGRLKVRIIRAGTQYNSQTASSTITTNTVYEVMITYAVSGNVTHVYVNNVDKSLTDPGTSTSWHSPLTDHDMAIFARGGTSTSGFFYGDLYDFRMYREKVVSATEVSHLYTNKWTIADIPFGQVCITNYCATYAESIPSPLKSFTSTSFTTTSFTA